MVLEEAYKILGINNKYVSSDDLREYYQIKLNQVHGANKEEQIRKINSAHQIIRNYRCSENWVGGRKYSSPNENLVPDVPKQKSGLHTAVSVFKTFCMIVGFIVIVGCLLAIFS